jgi:transglutaminase-like putative cysteine protease
MNVEKDEFLTATFFIDCDHEAVKEKSRELSASKQGTKETAISLFYFVREEIRYNIFTPRPTDADFKASHVLAIGEGYCAQKGVLLVALARAAGIPARLRFVEIRAHLTPPEMVEKRGSNIFPWHCLTELYIDGRWVKATPTYDRGYCEKLGLPVIDFDGENDAMLPSQAYDGRPNVDYLLDRGSFFDLPLPELRKASVSWKYLKT